MKPNNQFVNNNMMMPNMVNLPYNPMNASNESLYMQLYQKTWNNMQQNAVKEDLNKMNNILSLINLPVILPFHTHHPLINCKTPRRSEIGKSPTWKCNGCGIDYTYNVPSFYYTCCDFDLCQKCLLNLYAFQIVIYNYNFGMITENNIYNKTFFTEKVQRIHNHPLVPIIRENSYYTSDFNCNMCFQPIPKEQEFYYCSLCNFCICQLCYNNRC